MLSQLEQLSITVDGRYATDAELGFITEYVRSFDLRLQTYLKIQELEPLLVQQAYNKLRSIDPAFSEQNAAQIGIKWKQDTIRVLRYVAVAVLMNDSETLQERFLLWFRTIMKAFNAEQSCDLTYRMLQVVVKQYLTPAQSDLVCPVLELTRCTLGRMS
jgi:hypothetical protein